MVALYRIRLSRLGGSHLGRYQAFVLAISIAALAVLIAWPLSPALSVLLLIFFLLTFTVVRPLWESSSESARLITGLISLVSATIGYYVLPEHVADFLNSAVPAINRAFHLHIEQIRIEKPPTYLLPAVILAVIAILASSPARLVMGRRHREAREKKDTALRHNMHLFAGFWASRLDLIDRETDWSNYQFVPLEAEVESHSLTDNRKRVGDLISELRVDTTKKPILILGDPGSGKSVALRRLCRELLKEAPTSNKFPLYVNLKHWILHDPTCPPTTSDLVEYILSYVCREANDVHFENFLRQNFQRMLADGAFFFILDSFDEIPAVMDNPESSVAIDNVSEVIGKFLIGAHASRGIVASRLFKRPTYKLDTGSIYRIRPFDDRRIQRVLTHIGSRNRQQIKEFFRTRPDLASSATNPLVANLLAGYVREHAGRWPAGNLQLFDDYIFGRLKTPTVVQRMAECDLALDDCIRVAIKIAAVMTQSDRFGLEVPLDYLAETIPDEKVADVIRILVFSRLGRSSTDASRTFSFVHRRFQEYFVVIRLVSEKTVPTAEAVFSDTRFRDIYVLYCEVGDSDEVGQLAAACWKRIQNDKSEDADSSEAVQGLRFLVDALRSRELSESFQVELKAFISNELQRWTPRPLISKFATEAITLLDETKAAEVFPDALKFPSAWVRETAFRACRSLPQISDDLTRAAITVIQRYRAIPPTGLSLIREHEELSFSLSISNAFRWVARAEVAWLLDSFQVILAIAVLLALSPMVACCTLAAMWLFSKIPNPTDEIVRIQRIGIVMCLALLLGVVAIYANGIKFSFGTSITFDTLVFPWRSMVDGASARKLYSGAVCLASFLLLPVTPTILNIAKYRLPKPKKRKRRRDRPVARPNPKTVAELIARIITTVKDFDAKSAFKVIAVIVALPALFVLVGYMIDILLKFVGLRVLTVLLLALFASTVLIALAWMGYRGLIDNLSDFSILRSREITDVVQREVVEETLESFHTERYRKRYLQILLARHVRGSGQWKDGRIPFRHNDVASDMLLRLEERWLNLEH